MARSIKSKRKDNFGEIKMTEANDFLAQVVANVSNENNPGLNITPDDPRVQEHAKKLEKCLEEMLKWEDTKRD